MMASRKNERILKMKYNVKHWTLAFSGVGFMGTIKQGEICVDAATLQRAREKARTLLCVYHKIFNIGDKIKLTVKNKENIVF